MKRSIQLFTVSALAAGIAACGGDGSSMGAGSTGSVSVGLTDAPVDNAESVNIEVNALVLQHSDGDRERFEFDFPEPINLLSLQGGQVEALLQDQNVPSGDYSWMRLELGENNTINIDGGVYDLTTPSARGVQTSGFTVPAGGDVALTIDFDVRKSIVNPQNDPNTYKLKPVIRLVDNAEVGRISGTVAPELITEQCGSVPSMEESFIGNVYVHEGFDEEPDDIGSTNEPLVVAPVQYVDDHSEYTAAFIPAGNYTVSYSCGDDLVETAEGAPADDDITFVGSQDVEVIVDETTTADFEYQASQP